MGFASVGLVCSGKRDVRCVLHSHFACIGAAFFAFVRLDICVIGLEKMGVFVAACLMGGRLVFLCCLWRVQIVRRALYLVV